MGDKITVRQLAIKKGADPNFLLSKLRDSGLKQTTLDDVVDREDTEKILQSMVRPKGTLSRKNYKEIVQAKEKIKEKAKAKTQGTRSSQDASSKSGAKKSTDGNRSQDFRKDRNNQNKGGGNNQRSNASSSDSRRNNKPGGGQSAGGRPGGGGKPGGKFATSAKGKADKPAPKYKTAAPTPSFKDKSPKGKSKLLAADPRAEKVNQRYGVQITAEEELEIRDLIREQKVEDVAGMSSSALRRVVSSGRTVTDEIENKHKFVKPTKAGAKEITISGDMPFAELAQKLTIKKGALFGKISKMGLLEEYDGDRDARIIEKDTAILISEELGYKVTLEETSKDVYKSIYDLPEGVELVARAPIVTVMGHVDHGKTTLLDYIRKSKQVDNEAGNITQHFGAYSVTYKKDLITFFDTPGHAAFSDMRARGAKLTDIVILVVAADDGVKPQTVEAIQHAQSSNAAIVVAINKMDSQGADTEKVLKELASNGLQPEEWGGDIQCVPISAIKGDGVDKLLEAILAQASIMELKSAPKVPGRGYVIESSLDKNIGSLATIILEHGGMKRGDILLCGEHYGRIKLIKNDEDKPIKEVGSTVPVSVLGLNGVPAAGDRCLIVDSEKEARRLIELAKELEEKPESTPQLLDVEELLNSTESEPTQNNLIIKADVAGSLEAIKAMVTGLSNESTEFEIVTSGVGAITEGDISLARATNAFVIGFNVRTDSGAKKEMKRTPVPEVFYYSIIYELADQLNKLKEENLALNETEKIVGIALVKDVFSAKKYGQIAGCEVTEGAIHKDKPIRVLREDKVIYEGVLESLKRFKDNVQEVQQGVECGIGVKDYKNVKVGDQIEVYDKVTPS